MCGVCGLKGLKEMIKCGSCQPEVFCVSCDSTYHNHPKRKHHKREVFYIINYINDTYKFKLKFDLLENKNSTW